MNGTVIHKALLDRWPTNPPHPLQDPETTQAYTCTVLDDQATYKVYINTFLSRSKTKSFTNKNFNRSGTVKTKDIVNTVM